MDVTVLGEPPLSHHYLFPELAISWDVLVAQTDRQSDAG